MTLDWKHQHQHMTRTLRQKLDRLQTSYASPDQALQMVKIAIMTSLAYALPMVPCTAADVEKWDSMINTFVKRKFGLWACAPSALIRQDKQAFGLGCTSLAVEQHTRAATALVQSLWDQGWYGKTSRAMLDLQATYLTQVAGKPNSPLRKELGGCMRMWQLLGIYDSGLRVTHCGQEMQPQAVKLMSEVLASKKQNQASEKQRAHLWRAPWSPSCH